MEANKAFQEQQVQVQQHIDKYKAAILKLKEENRRLSESTANGDNESKVQEQQAMIETMKEQLSKVDQKAEGLEEQVKHLSSNNTILQDEVDSLKQMLSNKEQDIKRNEA